MSVDTGPQSRFAKAWILVGVPTFIAVLSNKEATSQSAVSKP